PSGFRSTPPPLPSDATHERANDTAQHANAGPQTRLDEAQPLEPPSRATALVPALVLHRSAPGAVERRCQAAIQALQASRRYTRFRAWKSPSDAHRSDDSPTRYTTGSLSPLESEPAPGTLPTSNA